MGAFFVSMVHLERRNGKFCVVEPDGTVVSSGCYKTKKEAVARLRAINMHVKEIAGFTVKEINGVWHWLGIVSNNWLDRDYQIIKASAHKRFVEMVDSGEYGQLIASSFLGDIPYFKEVSERGTPDLWFWHLPVPIGRTSVVGYDERGFLWAAGEQIEGEPYNRIFKAIAEDPNEFGMSHSMPNEFVEFEGEGEAIISGYVDAEFTVLPWKAAANFGTGMFTYKKEVGLMIPENKKQYIEEKFGKETVQYFEEMLGQLAMFAVDSDIPRKEKMMEEKELEATEELETDKVEETEEQVVEESTSEEGTEGVSEHGLTINPAEFKIPIDFKEFADEIAAGMKTVIADMQQSFAVQMKEQQDQIASLLSEVAKLKEAEEKRSIEKAVEETPLLSMSQWLAGNVGSVIGKEGARIGYNEDRKLYERSKESEKEPDTSATNGLPPTIAGFIKEQRGGRRNSVPNGQ